MMEIMFIEVFYMLLVGVLMGWIDAHNRKILILIFIVLIMILLWLIPFAGFHELESSLNIFQVILNVTAIAFGMNLGNILYEDFTRQ